VTVATYRWNDRAGRYINERGVFVSERTVRAVVDGIADAASARIAQASERLLNGEMSLGAWQSELQNVIRLSHLATATIAAGGAEQMTFSRYGSVGNEIKSEYQFLRGFAEDIASGRQPMNGSLTARARQYGQASRSTFEEARRRDQIMRGYQFERNVLHAGESCSECKAQTGRGLVPIGTLVPVGSRICRSNCRCSISYQRDAEAAA
jgi:hypothetical protein